MSRKKLRPILDAAVAKWQAKSCDELVLELAEDQGNQIEFESRDYNVEVTLLENAAEHIHFMVPVDDGALLSAFHPLSERLLLRRETNASPKTT